MKKIVFLFLPVFFLLVAGKNVLAQCTSGNCENGYGIYIYETSRYEGYFAGGLRNGKGSMYWSNGEKYVGEWLKGWRTGVGTYYWTDGDSYEGYFKENKITGYGIKYFANGTIYEGNWLEGNYHGYGTLTCGPDRFVNNCRDCTTYRGNWANDLKSGFGRCYDRKGNLLYEGEFLSDKPVGSYPNRF